jgi:hypothetical protein
MSINISFFAKQPFRVGPDRHLARVSSTVRANQIAEYIGAKLNPAEGYENDVCIYVKPHVKPGNDFIFEGKPYLDICDAPDLYHLARKHPEVPVIAASDIDYKTLGQELPNRIVKIPQQHCNFERIKRIRKGITTAGVIGSIYAFQYLPQGLREELAKRGIELIEFSKFSTRQDIIDFYVKIDVQFIWSPYNAPDAPGLYNPLKFENAAAFGIPTIALDKLAWHEMKGCYIPVTTYEEFLKQLDLLRTSKTLYDKISKVCLKKAEKYHIEKIAELYRKLVSE